MSATCSRPAGIWCAACHSVAPGAQVSLAAKARKYLPPEFQRWSLWFLEPVCHWTCPQRVTTPRSIRMYEAPSKCFKILQDSTNQTFSIVFRLYLLRSLFTAVGSTIEWYTTSPFSGSLYARFVSKFQLCWANRFSTSHFEWIDLWTLLVLQGFWARYHTGYVT